MRRSINATGADRRGSCAYVAPGVNEPRERGSDDVFQTYQNAMNSFLCGLRGILLSLIVFAVQAGHAAAGGDSLHFVTLSPRVGETIDRTEKVRYHLFAGVNAFESACLFQIDSGHYRLVFTLSDAGGAKRESTAVMSLAQVFRLSEIIDHIEEIEEARYASGQSAARIWVDGREIVRAPVPVVVGQDAAGKLVVSDGWRGGYEWDLPLGEPSGPRPPTMQYGFFMGAGVNFHTGSIGCIETMYTGIESRYSRAGFPVQGNPSAFSVNPRLVYLLMLRPFERVSFTAEVSPPPSEGDLQIGSLSLLVDYRLPLVRSAALCWQGGLGFSLFSVNITRKYGSARISAIDTVKGYYVLDQIRATAHPGGISLQTGIVLAASPQSEFLFYVRNTWCSELNVSLLDGSVAALRFTDFHAGIRFAVGLY